MSVKQGIAARRIEWRDGREIPPELCINRDDPRRWIVDLPGEHHDERAELAYRRGCIQGASYILRMVQEGAALERVKSYYRSLVMWRHHETTTKTIFPPIPLARGNRRG